MTKHRTPKPDDLLTASDVAEMYGWPINRAEALLRAITRGEQKAIEFEGFRRVFIRRADLESKMRRGSGVQS